MKKKSSFFWVYSIALFAVAFILILFSAFTGVRYKDEQYKAETLYKGAQTSAVSLTDENEALKKDNTAKTAEIEKLTEENKTLKSDVDTLTMEKEYVIMQTENLLKAERLWQNQRYNEAREVFKDLDSNVFSEYAMKKYNQLKNKIN
ncbi:MAG: hypothetical protein IJT38_03135 [Clostridia bacterium]|nr:hypothetical protein [Clostridia bacterium]